MLGSAMGKFVCCFAVGVLCVCVGCLGVLIFFFAIAFACHAHTGLCSDHVADELGCQGSKGGEVGPHLMAFLV